MPLFIANDSFNSDHTFSSLFLTIKVYLYTALYALVGISNENENEKISSSDHIYLNLHRFHLFIFFSSVIFFCAYYPFYLYSSLRIHAQRLYVSTLTALFYQ